MDIWERYYLKNISVYSSSKNSSKIFVKGHNVKNGIFRFTKVSLNSFSDQKGMRYAIYLRQKLIVLIVVSLWKQLGDLCWRNNEGTDFDMLTRNEINDISDKSLKGNVVNQIRYYSDRIEEPLKLQLHSF